MMDGVDKGKGESRLTQRFLTWEIGWMVILSPEMKMQ